MRHLSLTIVIMCSLLFHTACGKNMFGRFEEEEPAEDATIALEQNKPDKAIRILNAALEDDPENYQLVSLLSAATAQKYGIDAFTMVMRMVNSQKEQAENQTPSGSNNITALFSAVPASTPENIAGINEAIRIMMTIPATSRTRADNFYLSLMNTAALTLQTKKFDKDGDGLISPVELLDLSDDDAISILDSLLNAESAMADGLLPDSANSKASAEQISQIRSQIESQEGASTAEKLRNFLNKDKGNNNPTPP